MLFSCATFSNTSFTEAFLSTSTDVGLSKYPCPIVNLSIVTVTVTLSLASANVTVIVETTKANANTNDKIFFDTLFISFFYNYR